MSGICTNGACAPPACAPLCAPASPCGANTDCASQVCTANVCAPPACTPTCALGAPCGVSGDCASGQCTGGVCVTPTFSVGGTLAGLTPGESIVLVDQAGNQTTLSANGPFTLAHPVAENAMYSVTVATAPTTPITQGCTVTSGSGTMGTAAVTNVTVDCDLLAYFPFAGNANDASGYGNNGVITNATLTTGPSGAANTAYAFTGNGNIQSSPPTGFLPNGGASASLTAWLQPTQSTAEWGVVYWGTGNCQGLQFGIGDQGDEATFWGGCDDNITNLPIPVSTMATPAWTFVAISYSEATPTIVNVYVNGGAPVQASIAAALATPALSNLVIGMDIVNGDNGFVGNIGEVRLYGHALSTSEVAAVFAANGP